MVDGTLRRRFPPSGVTGSGTAVVTPIAHVTHSRGGSLVGCAGGDVAPGGLSWGRVNGLELAVTDGRGSGGGWSTAGAGIRIA
jgi:hypothetical protein